jgi:hypothetical protein
MQAFSSHKGSNEQAFPAKSKTNSHQRSESVPGVPGRLL